MWIIFVVIRYYYVEMNTIFNHLVLRIKYTFRAVIHSQVIIYTHASKAIYAGGDGGEA